MRSQTEAGHPELDSSTDPELIDAINQVFALFQINYHNQYYSAFGDNTKSENLAKNLWLNKLGKYSPDAICRAAEKIITENEYLPTLYKMLEACRWASMPKELPNAHNAYREACHRPSPKITQRWSHPLVYLSGRDCGWHILSTKPEKQTLPIFVEIYHQYCERILSGEQFDFKSSKILSEQPIMPADRSYNRKQLDKLRELLS